MEKYIENKLFVNLKQRLKRSNPKFEIAQVKLKKDRGRRPQSSYTKIDRNEEFEEPLILMASKPKVKPDGTENEYGDRVKTSTTQTTSNPLISQPKQKSFQRVRSAIGIRWNSQISDAKIMSLVKSNDENAISPSEQKISRNKDIKDSISKIIFYLLLEWSEDRYEPSINNRTAALFTTMSKAMNIHALNEEKKDPIK